MTSFPFLVHHQRLTAFTTFIRIQCQPLTVMPPPPPRLLPLWKLTLCLAGHRQILCSNSSHHILYYFPQGHIEQCPSSPSSSSFFLNNHHFTLNHPMIPCKVLAVRFFTNPHTDQRFVKYLLQPMEALEPSPIDVDDTSVASFVRVLTPSDANNGAFCLKVLCGQDFSQAKLGDRAVCLGFDNERRLQSWMGVPAHLPWHSTPAFANHRLE